MLGEDLPLIGDDVTVEHLLAHRSGIGDYLDEDAVDDVTDYVMPVPVHELATTEEYLPVLDGIPTVFPAGERFAYCNGGYVVLALIAERAERQCRSTSSCSSACASRRAWSTPRSCAPTSSRARGAGLPRPSTGLRTNVLHLPVRGSGDGGIYSTAADFSAFWAAFFAGRIVVAATGWPRWCGRAATVPEESKRYGLGFWLHETGDVVWLKGYDAGVSFCSTHDPGSSVTHTVISNTSEGAWPDHQAPRRAAGDVSSRPTGG